MTNKISGEVVSVFSSDGSDVVVEFNDFKISYLENGERFVKVVPQFLLVLSTEMLERIVLMSANR
jgi:hypothetical protein